ncbi:hypothetical protein Tco_0078506 [Tanacetum coccineum]
MNDPPSCSLVGRHFTVHGPCGGNLHLLNSGLVPAILFSFTSPSGVAWTTFASLGKLVVEFGGCCQGFLLFQLDVQQKSIQVIALRNIMTKQFYVGIPPRQCSCQEYMWRTDLIFHEQWLMRNTVSILSNHWVIVRPPLSGL